MPTTELSEGFAKLAQQVAPIVLLAFFWCWESWWPFFGHGGRLRHAARNLALALINTIVLGFVFGYATTKLAFWTTENQWGLLNNLSLDAPLGFLLAFVLLDAWMYLWHRANHTLPFLWRFHRMHHSDQHMDVTTATRFHLGEHVISSILRLGLIPVLGFNVWMLVIYDTLVIAVIMFHHADISVGHWDRWLRWVIVTPDMHKIHHSDWRPETDSNYSTILSIWDRLAGSFRMRADPHNLVFGLAEFSSSTWQSFWGMWRTPFAKVRRDQSTDAAILDRPRLVLFVCNENCNRSQMAEAFVRMLGKGRIRAYSAGCRPASSVHEKAVVTMKELGYDLDGHEPKPLSEVPHVEFDMVVAMGADVEDAPLNARHKESWEIPVPKNLPLDQFRTVRDQIGARVKVLVDQLREAS